MILTDGAWGTQLQARGLDFGDCPDEWNLTHPDEVAAVAASYVDAGSEIILTNTFRASRIPLAGYGLADKVTAINKMGVALSKRGAAGRAKVFASIGPSGKMLASGEVSCSGTVATYCGGWGEYVTFDCGPSGRTCNPDKWDPCIGAEPCDPMTPTTCTKAVSFCSPMKSLSSGAMMRRTACGTTT